MKFPIISTEGHQGMTLQVDPDRETLSLYGSSGEHLGTVPWSSVIEQVLASHREGQAVHRRTAERAPLALKVRYVTTESRAFESLTAGIGGGGLFIESASPLPVGTEITLEFALPDQPLERLNAKGKVVWVRGKAERQVLFPGMGVEFTDIGDEARKRVAALVTSLNRNRQLD
ncbi:MAG: TIGR02266 family protein [Nitrospiraceae bacterium]